MFIVVYQILQVWLGNGADGQCVSERRQLGECLYFVHEVYDVSIWLVSNEMGCITFTDMVLPRKLAQMVKCLTSIWVVPGLNFSWNTEYSHWGFWWFTSVQKTTPEHWVRNFAVTTGEQMTIIFVLWVMNECYSDCIMLYTDLVFIVFWVQPCALLWI